MGSTYTQSDGQSGEWEIRSVLKRATAVGCLIAMLAVGVASAERIQLGNLIMQIGGGFAPTTLPANRNAPISLQGYAHIKTKDGSHPPALTRLTIEYDKHGRVETRGLRVCRRNQLENTTCLLYTSDAADDLTRVDIGGRRI